MFEKMRFEKTNFLRKFVKISCWILTKNNLNDIIVKMSNATSKEDFVFF
jgi:hypothetical protein